MRELEHEADLHRNNTAPNRLDYTYHYQYNSYSIVLNSLLTNYAPSSDFAFVALECNPKLMRSMLTYHEDPVSGIGARQYTCMEIHRGKSLVLQAQHETGAFRFSYLDVSEMLAGLYVGARLFGERLPDLSFEIRKIPSTRAVVTGIWAYNRAPAPPET